MQTMAGLSEAAGLRGGAIGVAVFGVVATFTPSLDGSLCVVFVAAAVLLVAAFAYAWLRWAER